MRVYLHTFGCKANQYDTERVRQTLESAGASVVNDPRAADCAVVNSCTVTHVGESKMRGLVRRLHRLQPEIDTVIMGCAAAVDDGTLAALPGVTRVVGGADPVTVAAGLGLAVPEPDTVLRSFPRGARAWVKIQDGCDEHCTFCATTLARGANRSRDPQEVVREALVLAQAHEELVLTGVHIGTYGRDCDTSLGSLVELLVSRVPRVRFRLTSVEATEVDDRLADLMSSAPERLAPHLHAPLQSGSDRMLKRMGRHWYTARSYRDRCQRLAARLPSFGLGADIIVGFPGETDEDHTATRAMLRDLPFTYLHVFPYSERPDTAARRLGPPVDPQRQADRAAELRALAGEHGARYRARRLGETADVVTLGRQHGRWRGLTEDYLDVYLPTLRAWPSRFSGVLAGGPDGLVVQPTAGA
jgi:threonylcarbamoyladenosine tRNA methylthiotransferase MtaB